MRFLLLALSLTLAGCPKPSLAPVSDCAPESFRCHNNAPQQCSATRRWTPVGDVRDPDCDGTCAINDAGVAFCLPRSSM